MNNKKYDSTNRRKKSMETKVKIFKTALKLFYQQGYENVTVEQITRHAGVAKGTFYIHYQSKEAIMSEQFQKIDSFYEERYQAYQKDEKATIQLKAFLMDVAVLTRDVLGLEGAKVVYKSHIGASVSAQFLVHEERPYFRILNELISLGIKNKEFCSDMNQKDILLLVTRGVRGTIFDWTVSQGSFDLVEAFDQYFDWVFKSFVR